MSIPDQTIEDVRAASDVVDVVGDYVRLKRSGSNYFGLCPFHNEKSPSFSVNPALGIFKCFGCGAGGDVFSFISRVEHVGFIEAVKLLAERAGIPISEPGDTDAQPATAAEPVYHALRFAARFFYTRLTQAEQGRRGLEYLRKRGFTKDTIKHFGVGYAPDAWDALVVEAEKNHISAEVLEQAGLAIPRRDGSGYYDRYRDRIIFPILSQVGKVLGFGGRVISGQSDQPKYINSPETEVYSKGRVLYGLYHGKQAIRRAEEAVLVEGYTDVISLHQAGVQNVVAVCGTSLTDDHVKSLSRYVKRIIFINDADAAGENATVRGVRLALAGGLTPYVIELPEGQDPDSFAQHYGQDDVDAYLRERRWSFVQFLLNRARRAGRLDHPEQEPEALHEVLALIASIADPLARDAYVREMSKLLDKPDILLYQALEQTLVQQQRRNSRKERRPTKPSSGDAPPEAEDSALDDVGTALLEITPSTEALPEEQNLIRIMLDHGMSLVEFVLGGTALEEFTEGPARETVLHLIDQYQDGRIQKEPFLDGTYGEEVQSFVSGVFMDRFEVSENWARRNIPVPRQNGDPYLAAASAIKFLRMDRIKQAIQALKVRRLEMPRDSEDFLTLGLDIIGLQSRLNMLEKNGIPELEQE